MANTLKDTSITGTLSITGSIGVTGTITTTSDVTVGGDITVGGGDIYAAAGTDLNIRASTGGNLRLYNGNAVLAFYLNAGDGQCYYNASIYGSGKNIGNNNSRWKQIYTEIGDFSGRVSMSGLPTSDAGLNVGDLYNDSGTVKIKQAE